VSVCCEVIVGAGARGGDVNGLMEYLEAPLGLLSS